MKRKHYTVSECQNWLCSDSCSYPKEQKPQVTPCFMLASAAHCLAVWYLFESEDIHTPFQPQRCIEVTSLVDSMGCSDCHLWTTYRSKLSPAGYRHLTLVFVCAGIQALVLQRYVCWTTCTIVPSTTPVPCVYIEVRTKLSFARLFVTLFLKLFLHTKQDAVWLNFAVIVTVKNKCNVVQCSFMSPQDTCFQISYISNICLLRAMSRK
jgi:hypothetical protein